MTFQEVKDLFGRVYVKTLGIRGQRYVESLQTGYLTNSPIEPTRLNWSWVNIKPTCTLGSDDQEVIAWLYDPSKPEVTKITKNATRAEILELASRHYNP